MNVYTRKKIWRANFKNHNLKESHITIYKESGLKKGQNRKGKWIIKIISTDNLIELNDLIYPEVKLRGDKIVIPQVTQTERQNISGK